MADKNLLHAVVRSSCVLSKHRVGKYNGGNNGTGDFAQANRLTEPLFQYDHQNGRSVTGGFVYRGSKLPDLQGKHVFADLAGGDGVGTRLFAGDVNNGQFEALQISAQGSSLPGNILSFGTDAADELYIMTTGGDIFLLDAPAPLLPPSANMITNGSFEAANGPTAE